MGLKSKYFNFGCELLGVSLFGRDLHAYLENLMDTINGEGQSSHVPVFCLNFERHICTHITTSIKCYLHSLRYCRCTEVPSLKKIDVKYINKSLIKKCY